MRGDTVGKDRIGRGLRGERLLPLRPIARGKLLESYCSGHSGVSFQLLQPTGSRPALLLATYQWTGTDAIFSLPGRVDGREGGTAHPSGHHHAPAMYIPPYLV